MIMYRPRLAAAATKAATGVGVITVTATVTPRRREAMRMKGAAVTARRGGPPVVSETDHGRIIPTERLNSWIQACPHPLVPPLGIFPPPEAPSGGALAAGEREACRE